MHVMLCIAQIRVCENPGQGSQSPGSGFAEPELESALELCRIYSVIRLATMNPARPCLCCLVITSFTGFRDVGLESLQPCGSVLPPYVG